MLHHEGLRRNFELATTDTIEDILRQAQGMPGQLPLNGPEGSTYGIYYIGTPLLATTVQIERFPAQSITHENLIFRAWQYRRQTDSPEKQTYWDIYNNPVSGSLLLEAYSPFPVEEFRQQKREEGLSDAEIAEAQKEAEAYYRELGRELKLSSVPEIEAQRFLRRLRCARPAGAGLQAFLGKCLGWMPRPQ